MTGELAVVLPDKAELLQVGARTALIGPQSLSGGSYNVMDQEIEPGRMVPPHAHEVEDQAVFVVGGTLTVWVDGVERDVPEGAYALRPAGKPHAIWNATDQIVRFLEITSPAERFEEYIKRVSDLNVAGGSSPEGIAELAAGYGVTFFPEVTAELQARTGMSPAGGFWR